MKYKLILSDFDNTLTHSDHTVSARTIEAIKSYVARGGIFTVCTGRMLAAILPQVESLGIGGIVCAYQGGTIYDVERKMFLRESTLSPKLAYTVCREFCKLGKNVNVYYGPDIYVNYSDDALTLYESIISVKAKRVTGCICDYVSSRNEPVNNVLLMVDKKERDDILLKLSKTLPLAEVALTSSAPMLVEAGPIASSKSNALRFLCDYYKIDAADTLAFGDSYNDISMLREAGLGVAVANADEAVKRAANVITLSNNEDGVAKIIEELID